MKDVQPTRPDNLNPLAIDMIERLKESPEAANVVVGGGVALNCYSDVPRMTYDIDAWWAVGASLADRRATVERIREIAQGVAATENLTVAERLSASEVVSIELQADRRTVFSFQVAPRDVEIDPPIVAGSPFAPIAIETLADNLGQKMMALVDRGAPRDFLDVFRITQEEVATTGELWDLFAQKQPERDLTIARVSVEMRLNAIEARRPFESIPLDEQSQAAALRSWVREELIANVPKLTPPSQPRSPDVREIGSPDRTEGWER